MAKSNESQVSIPSTALGTTPEVAPEQSKYLEDQSPQALDAIFNTDPTKPQITFPSWVTVLHRGEDGSVRAKANLSRFKTDDAEIIAVRDPKAYSPTDDDLMDLGKSLNKNGNLRMLTDPKVIYTPGKDHLTVIGGNRRIVAALAMLKAGTFKDVPVCCVIFTPEQKDEVASLDNSYRKEYNEMEHYRDILHLDKKGKAIAEIAMIKGQSDDTIRRYLSISKYPVLVKMLEDRMPYSKLARITDKFKDKSPSTIEQTLEFLDNWHTTIVPKRRMEKEMEAAKKQRTVNAESLYLGKMLISGEFEGWIRDISGDKCPTGKTKRVVISAELKGSNLRLSGVNINIDEYTEHELAAMHVDIQTDMLSTIRTAMKFKKAQSDDGPTENDEEKARLLKQLGFNKYEDEVSSAEGYSALSKPADEDDEADDEETDLDEDA